MQDPLQDIKHYSPTMTISQVLKFCQRKNLNITKGMIQNYIRDGLLPSPSNKRQYTHKHLAALVLIYRLKTVFDMPTIREAMLPFMDQEGVSIEDYQSIVLQIGDLFVQCSGVLAPALKAQQDGGTLLSMMFATQLKSAIVD